MPVTIGVAREEVRDGAILTTRIGVGTSTTRNRGVYGTGSKLHIVRQKELTGIADEQDFRENWCAPAGANYRKAGDTFLRDLETSKRYGEKAPKVVYSAHALCNGNGQFMGGILERVPQDLSAVTCEKCRKWIEEAQRGGE